MHISIKFIIFLLFFLVNLFSITAQRTNLTLTNIVEKDNKLTITYDIINYKPEEIFDISLKVKDSSGVEINPSNLSGDIGRNIKGGANKKIEWDIVKDNIFIDEDVEFQINAVSSIDITYLKFSSLLLSSTLLPGMGLKKIQNKNSYLIMSALGYSGVGVSIYFYIKGEDDFNSYKNEKDPIQRIDYYNSANSNNRNAKIAGISAASIWFINYIWLTSKWKKENNKIAYYFNKRSDFYVNYNPIFKQTIFSLNFSF